MWLLWGKRIKNTNLGQIWIFSFKSISLRHSYKCLLLYFLSDRKNTLRHHLLLGTNSFFFSLKMKRLHLLCLYLCACMPWFMCRGQRTTCGSWFFPWQNGSWSLDCCPEACWQNTEQSHWLQWVLLNLSIL